MKTVFADTFHFLALLNEDDPADEQAVVEHRRALQNLITTDCVILELGDALCDPTDRGDFLAFYESLRRDRRIRLVRLTPDLLERGIKRFQTRQDKDWPLSDCISFVVMEEEQITDALTGDRHFEQAGFRALLK